MQRADRESPPQLPSEIWAKIAERLPRNDRLRGFDRVCREFHSLPWQSVQLRFVCDGDDYSMASIKPPFPWVIAVWPRISHLSVTFSQDNTGDMEDELKDTVQIMETLRVVESRWAGSASPTFLDVRTWRGWDCALKGHFLQGCLSLLPNLVKLSVHRVNICAMPALQSLQHLHLYMGDFSPVLLKSLQQLGSLRRLSLCGSGSDESAVALGPLQLERAYHLQSVSLSTLVPDLITLPPSCELHLSLPSHALTQQLQECLESTHLTKLWVKETAGRPVQALLSRRLGRDGSLRTVTFEFRKGVAEPPRRNRHASVGPVVRLGGPLLQHCTALCVAIHSSMGVVIRAHMQLSSLELWSDCSHPKMIDAELMGALGESLRMVDICLSTQERRGYKKGTKPAWCRRLLAAAVNAEKRFCS